MPIHELDVRLRGQIERPMVLEELPLMRDGGSIIMTDSIASVKGFPGLSFYKAFAGRMK
jgi:hypothetical protein